MREADLAIRFSPPRQADLVQRHLMTVNMHIYAAASYIKKHGVPQTTKDLDKHRIVVYGEDVRPPVPDVNWLLRVRSEEHTSELQSLMRISYAVFRLKKKKQHTNNNNTAIV